MGKGQHIPKIPKPISTPVNELGTLLNLACIKATGFPLPASYYSQDWFYKIDEDGKRRAHFKPSSIPSVLSNPWRTLMPDGIEQQIKRASINQEIMNYFRGEVKVQVNPDSVVYILMTWLKVFQRTLLCSRPQPLCDVKDSDYRQHIQLGNTVYTDIIPKIDTITSGYNGVISKDTIQLVWNAAKQYLNEFPAKPGGTAKVSGLQSGEYIFGENLSKLIKTSNFKGNRRFKPNTPSPDNKLYNTDWEFKVKEERAVYFVLYYIGSIGDETDCAPGTADEYRSWFKDLYGDNHHRYVTCNKQSQISKIMKFKDVPETKSVWNGCNIRQTVYEWKDNNLPNNPHLIPCARLKGDFTKPCINFQKKDNGHITYDSLNGHCGHANKLLTQGNRLQVKQSTWITAFWLIDAEFRDDIYGRRRFGNHHHDLHQCYNSLGSMFGYYAQPRGRQKVWDKVKKESPLLLGIESSKDYEKRYLGSIMKILSNT